MLNAGILDTHYSERKGGNAVGFYKLHASKWIQAFGRVARNLRAKLRIDVLVALIGASLSMWKRKRKKTRNPKDYLKLICLASLWETMVSLTKIKIKIMSKMTRLMKYCLNCSRFSITNQKIQYLFGITFSSKCFGTLKEVQLRISDIKTLIEPEEFP